MGRPHEQQPFLPPLAPRDGDWVDVPGLNVRIRVPEDHDAIPRGGFGTVYFGEHCELKDEGRPIPVAVKFFHHPLISQNPRTKDEEEDLRLLLELFGSEAARAFKFSHESVIATHNYSAMSEHDGWRPAIVMQRADMSCRDLLNAFDILEQGAVAERNRLPLDCVRQVIRDAALGLEELHNEKLLGVVHNDVKDSNVFLKVHFTSADDRSRLWEAVECATAARNRCRRAGESGPSFHFTPEDISAAKIIVDAVLKTPFTAAIGDLGVASPIGEELRCRFGQDGFKAPEQLRGNVPVGAPTDLFGLGVVLERLLQASESPQDRPLSNLRDWCGESAPQNRPPSAKRVAGHVGFLVDRSFQLGVDLEKRLQLQSDGQETFKFRYVPRRRIDSAFRTFAGDGAYRLLRIKGGPGTGKSTALAQMAAGRYRGAAYFLSWDERPNLNAAVAELINALLVEFLLEDEREGPVRKSPPDKDDLIRVLEAIQRKWGDSFRSGERIWLYVDALDEADSAEFSYANLLPTASDLDRLPDPVRMVVSSRHDPAFADLERHERCLLVDLDLADEQTARQTIDEAAEFARRLLAATGLETAPIPHDLAAALLGNFQLVKIVCSDWRDRSPSSAEAESEIKLLASIDAGEVGGHAAFHRIYRKYFWNRIERKCGPDRVDEATRIAGYLAVGRGAVPKDMLRQYDATLAHVEGLLTILRPFLRRRRVWSPHDSDRPWLEAYSFDHETYRSFVIDSKDTDPAVSNIVADELREKIAACYQPKSALEWDHFGLRSCARLHLDRHSPAEAVALIKRPDFLLAVINAHEEDSEGERRTAEGLGVDSLRAMVQQVQQAIN